MDGMQWNGSTFITGSKIDDGELCVREEDVYDLKIDFMDTHDTRHHTDMTISLLDIARPAKPKGDIPPPYTRSLIQNGSTIILKSGDAKHFEVVQKVRNVIALEDDLEGLEYQSEDDEWEQIYDEQRAEEPRTYSSVLRGNET